MVERVGRGVATSCGVDVKSSSVDQLRGVFTAEGPVDIWDVGPEEDTSDEEPDGTIKPKLAAGRYGEGPPMQVHHNGDFKPITDGSGLCSAGRWHPQVR